MSTILVAAAVLIEDRKVLLTRRPAGGHLEHLWEFPGGKVEPDEDPSLTVVRELKEEIGIDVRVCDSLDVTFWRYPTRNVLLLFYVVERVDRTQPIAHIEVADHHWYTLEELQGVALPPADVPVVEKVARLLRTP